MDLRLLQTAALQAIHDVGGMLGPIRVGGGKTLLSYLAGVVLDARRTLLMVPAKLQEKTHRDFALLRRHWQAPSRLEIMSYELLSRDRGLAELKIYSPDLIIADEAHKFKAPRSVCTKRMHRYLTQQQPETKYVDMSGTITKRSILEYYHRQNWAIPDGLQPLPRKYPEARDWADAIDKKNNLFERLLPGALTQLCTDDEAIELSNDPRRATRILRQAYCRRLMSAPGVVGTEDQFDGVMALIIQGHEIDPGDAVIEAFRGLRDDWALPDGQPIDQPTTLWRHARELAQGFYYTWWSQKGFNECLWQIQKKEGFTTSNEIKLKNVDNNLRNLGSVILKKCVLMTEKDTALVQACARLRSGRNENSSGIYGPGTASLSINTNSSTQNTMVPVISANKKEVKGPPARAAGEVVLRLITTTEQARFGGCSVPLAIERSECWEMILRAYPVLLSILQEAIDAAAPPRDWLAARRAWAATVRQILKNYHDIDSPMLAARAIDQGRLIWAREPLEAWRIIKDSFTPNPVAEWIDTACLEAVAAWAKEHRGLIWVHEKAFGERLSRETGLPYYGARGLYQNRPIEAETNTCIASIAANSEGRNLQHFAQNLVVSCPPGGAVWEQMVGRTHRDGQDADEVTFDVLLSCYEQWDVFRQARRDAEYIEHTTAQAQKLNFADVTVQTEDEISMRCEAGDPLWDKANAQFFEVF
jgi:hypothetical protein